MISISAEGLPLAIERQAAAGVAEADVVVLLCDGQAGIQPGDEEIAGWLRQNHPEKPVVLAVNKCENHQKAPLMVRSCRTRQQRQHVRRYVERCRPLRKDSCLWHVTFLLVMAWATSRTQSQPES